MPKANGMITILDLNDAILSGTAPLNPVVGTIWIDSSVTPNILKAWNGTSWALQSLKIGSLDPVFHQDVQDIKTFVTKASSDGYITSGEKLNVKLLLVQITGDTLATTIPTLATIDAAKGGEAYLARAEAVAAGVPLSHADYVAYETAFNSLRTYLNALTPLPWVSGDTVVVEADWTAKWDIYYEKLSRLKVTTSTYLANSIKPGKDYNGVTLTTADGIVVLRGDNLIRTKLNATEGLSIEKNNGSGVWTKVFGTNTDGKITATGLVISADSTLNGAIVSTVVGDASAGRLLANDFGNDTKVTAGEKILLKREWETVQAEYVQLLAQGTAEKVATTAYTNAYNALNGTVPRIALDILATMSTTYTFTTANRDLFNAKWKLYYEEAEKLRKTIAASISTTATTANTTANTLRDTTVPALTTRVTNTESAITQTNNEIALRVTTTDYEQGLADTRKYVASRGENLVTNGTGYLGTNFNFSPYVFDATESYVGNGSFRHTGGYYVRQTDELIPVNPENLYQLSYLHKSDRTTGSSYAGIAPYDRDGNFIAPQNTMFLTKTPTTLSQDLKQGDTIVHLTNLSDFIDSTASHQRTLIFWNYISKGGFAYPPNTYSQNAYLDLWDVGNIDYVNNRITLRAPWPLATVLAGTPLSQGSSGGSYKYVTSSTKNTLDWVAEKGTIGGVDFSGTNAKGLPPYTANVKIVFLTNSAATENDVSTWINAVEFKDISMENNANSALTAAKAEIKVTTDAISTNVSQLTTEVSGHTTTINNQQTSINSMNNEIALRATKDEIISRLTKVRYIKVRANGNTVNVGNHLVELEAFNVAGTNVALGKTAFLSNNGLTDVTRVTDGSRDTNSWFSLGAGGWLQLDLGAVYDDIEYLNVWFFYGDGRTYLETLIEVSGDGVAWTKLHTGDLKTTSKGFIVQVNDNLSVNRINSAESAITVQSGQISSKVEKTDFTGEKTISMINQTPDTVKILAKNLELQGKVTFSTFDSATQTKVNNIETTANNASTKIDNLKVGGRNLLPLSKKFSAAGGSTGNTGTITAEGYLQVVSAAGNGNYFSSFNAGGYGNAEAAFNEGDDFTISFEIKSPDHTKAPTIYLKPGMGYFQLVGTMNTEFSTFFYSGKWKKVGGLAFHLGFSGIVGTTIFRSFKLEKGNVVSDWSAAPEDNVGLYTWIRYADSAAGAGLTTSPTGKTYIGFAYNKNDATGTNVAADYTWSLIKGDTGVQGPPGVQGQTTYTWIKYADSVTGTGLSDSPAGKTYIGLAHNKTTATESTTATDYTWSLIQGPQGNAGVSPVTLTLELPDGTTFQGNNGNPKTINVRLREGETDVTSSAVLKWYFNGAVNSNLSNLKTLEVYPADVPGNITIRVVATYNGVDYQDSVVFMDLDDVYQVSIIGEDKIKNSLKPVTLTAVVFRGADQITNGFRCRWSNMGTTPAVTLYEGINTTGTLQERGVTITLTPDQIDGKIDLLCEVSVDTVEQELDRTEEVYTPSYDSKAYAAAMGVALA